MKESGYPLEPHFHFVINFRRNCVKAPHMIKEIDELTGKAWEFKPFWKKTGGYTPRKMMRFVGKKEAKKIAREPKWLSARVAKGTF
jgi:hypothetical protein